MISQIFQDRGFQIHAMAYAAVNILLIVINLTLTPEHLWFYWPLIGWGIGLAGHAYGVHRKLQRPPQRRRPGS